MWQEIDIEKDTEELRMLLDDICPKCKNELELRWLDNDGGCWDCFECSIRFHYVG